MVTSRKPAEPPEEVDDGFNDTQRSQLSEMIAAAVGGAKPPTNDPGPKGPPPVTDDDWDAMTDRKRESWVRALVDTELDRLVKEDEQRTLASTVAELAAKVNAKPEVEKTPGGTTKLQKLQHMLWGRPDDTV